MHRRRRLVGRVALLALALIAALTAVALLQPVLPADIWVTRALQSYRWGLVSRAMYGVSIFGYTPWSAVTVAVSASAAALLIGWRAGASMLALAVAQGLLNITLKWAIGRPRPVAGVVEVFTPETGYSFPSGHVMLYTVLFGFAVFLILTHMRGRWRWACAAPLILLIALVGPSRIILGAHWLSDVITAYLVGLVILAAAIEGYLLLVAPTPGASGEG
jgi:membrane-associated phospholipid phosphatase